MFKLSVTELTRNIVHRASNVEDACHGPLIESDSCHGPINNFGTHNTPSVACHGSTRAVSDGCH